MRLFHGQANQPVIGANRFDSGQYAPGFESSGMRIAADRELDHMMSAKPVNEIGGRTLGNDLTVIDDRKTVAKALGFIHVVSR